MWKIIISGYDSSGNRIPEGSCGFGEGILSSDDFVSTKFMGETKEANSTFDTINDIPKGQEDSDGGKKTQASLQINPQGSKESFVGDDAGTKHTGTGNSDIKDNGTVKHTCSDSPLDKTTSSKDGSKLDLEFERSLRKTAGRGNSF